MKANRTFYIALVVSVVIHLLVIQLFSFQHEKSQKEKKQPKQEVMDVSLLSPEKVEEQPKPEQAQAISNKNQRAKKEEKEFKEKPQIAKSPKPKPASHQSKKETVNPKHQQEKRVEKNKVNVAQKDSDIPVKKVEASTKAEKKYKNIDPTNFNLSNSAINNIVQQSQHTQREHRLQSMLSSEADIPINTREEKYAPYAHALVRALEEQWRPSDEDYQVYSERDRQVLLRITINRKGVLESVKILRPSPIDSLNQSALKALRDAAPYRPLPVSWGFDRVSFKLTFQVIEDRAVFRTF